MSERILNHIVPLFFSQNYYVEVNRLLRIDNNLFEFVYIYEGMA